VPQHYSNNTEHQQQLNNNLKPPQQQAHNQHYITHAALRGPATGNANEQQLASHFSMQTETTKQPSNVTTLTINESGPPATTAKKAAHAPMHLPDAMHTCGNASMQQQLHRLARVCLGSKPCNNPFTFRQMQRGFPVQQQSMQSNPVATHLLWALTCHMQVL
jgi:hypothetical protein